ncbi:ATP-binding cassette domain-containing protein [Vibrio sp. S4M6]|uniref:ATP-binding cassette domain-containing protein n=1 Tax=Vibrio sinus TaxID=2946865 RepID=UPI002029BBB7|nr:ATP-binding cassette domain-containing protein [Vibrio sinus]MCL9782040.1 ATP-binding cassette domain-containing protein [Vibrio sinus]
MTLYIESLTVNTRLGEALFSNFNLEVQCGEIATLMGPSGCGKSTLLSLIAGHLNEDFTFSGSLKLQNEEITTLPPHQRGVGILFQDDLLFPHLTVWQNLAFALPNQIKKVQRKEMAYDALSSIKLASLADSYPDQISGGQRARISLTRMLLAKPKLALLDEPFSKLDRDIRKEFREWVVEQLHSANIPAILVTHDIEDKPSQGQILSWPWSR